MHALHFVANLNTAHTFDAFACLPDDRRAQIHVGALRLYRIGLVVDIQVMRELLELAVSAADTDSAVGIVLTEDQPQVCFPGLPDPWGVGLNLHSLQNLRVACGHQTLCSPDFHHAHTAGGDFIDPFQKAQMRDGNPGFFCGFQNGCAPGGGQFPAIDLEVHHFSTRPPLKIPYPK